jgi:hypothetical protein
MYHRSRRARAQVIVHREDGERARRAAMARASAAAIAAQIWWSWGESNPRPKAFVRQIYTLSWLVWF